MSRILLSAIALVGSAQFLQVASFAPADAQDSVVRAQLDTLRTVTRAFRSLDSAVAAGYPRTVNACLVHEHHGAMGYHHSNRALTDAKMELRRPEILLYERLADSTYRLNGVEYVVPFTAWSRDSVPPTILGQRLEREDNLGIWFLHVWLWNPNPNGMFAHFHPNVACPQEARVYRPFVRDSV